MQRFQGSEGLYLSEYLGTDAVELTPDAEEVWLPVADHDVADVGLLQAVHYAGGH